jgi:predicted nucleic acid-binding protein
VVERVAADANVLVSLLTDRNPGQLERARALFAAARDGQVEIVLPQSAVSECAFVIRRLYEQPAAEVRDALADLLDLPGVEAIHDLDWGVVLDLWPRPLSELGDALLVAACRASSTPRVATFDRTLARRLGALGLRSYW